MMAQKSNNVVLASLLVMAPLFANAHMIMANPKPYGQPSSSPLDASGSNFPCQMPAYTVTSMNDWAVGSTQTLAFGNPGSAVHGGGSCQISVTTDKAPTKNSVWKVIHSIEGGCPSSAAGNLADGDHAGTFQFTIPKDLPNGEMSMAWTWFNKIGNREMYMNCAPVKISGGQSDTKMFDALPDMAKANIGMGTCTTKEGTDYSFENPGQSVAKLGTGSLAPLCGGASTPGGSSSPAQQSYAAPAPVPTTMATAPAKNPPAASAPPAMGSSAAPAQPSAAPAQPSAAPAQPSAAPAQPSAAPSQPQQPGSGNASTSCNKDGDFLCNGQNQYAICSNGVATWMPVAYGTICAGGSIQKRTSYVRRHMHRHMRASY